MQLDVEVSPLANASQTCYMQPDKPTNLQLPTCILQLASSINMPFAKCFFFLKYELFSSHLSLYLVTDRQKAVNKSPPCMSTGVLKNIYIIPISKNITEQ